MNKTWMAALIACCAWTAGPAAAADTGCEARATEKKLAGAARTSYVRKCEKDGGATAVSPACEKSAADKKLAGAAKNSHMKKCMADSGGGKM